MRENIIALIEETLELEHGIISEDTKISDVEGWDSLGHILIIGALEEKMNIVIPLEAAIKITSVAELFEQAGV